MAEVIMPKMSDAMIEGKVLAWRKHVGDSVARGDIIAEIETDKVNVEIEADSSGTLSEVVVQEGGTVPVGAVIAYINGGARAESAGTPRGAAPAPASQPVSVPRASKTPEPSGPPETPSASPVPGTPGEAPSSVREASPADEHVKASPLARRLAAERGVDLTRVTGTGPGGRIVERDIEASVASRQSPGPARPVEARPASEPEFEDVELSRMRQAIARSVVHSKQVAPHFYVTTEVDMTRALDLREQLKEAYGAEQGKVSVNDLILKATALALRQHPDLNAQFVEPATLRRFHGINLGIMVAVPDGLILPVLRDADRLPLVELAREARRLIEGARERHLRQEEYSGATFSVSNLGMFDVTNFVAIISSPQAGILAVGRIQDRPVVRDTQIVVRPIMEATISADHRVTDGAGAAQFLVDAKHLLENPLLLVTPP
jgi:pyruvate dehydrogenase E2 component (dihydrolipoamide acetyltransferase)